MSAGEIQQQSPSTVSMDFEYCPACANELDTGYECLACDRDWRPWAMVFVVDPEARSHDPWKQP